MKNVVMKNEFNKISLINETGLHALRFQLLVYKLFYNQPIDEIFAASAIPLHAHATTRTAYGALQ